MRDDISRGQVLHEQEMKEPQYWMTHPGDVTSEFQCITKERAAQLED
jgi:hypothetical protein